MFRNLLCMIVVAIILAGCVSVHKTEHIAAKDDNTPKTSQYSKKSAQILRHVVMFKFKDGTTNEQIREIENAFCALPSKIDAIHDLEWGTDVSVENRSEGFTHCFIVTFLSETDRAKYIPHPEHKKFGEILGPYLDKVLVVDYWTK